MDVEQSHPVPGCQRFAVNMSRNSAINFPRLFLGVFPGQIRLAIVLQCNSKRLELLCIVPDIQVHSSKANTFGHKKFSAAWLDTLIPALLHFAFKSACKLEERLDILGMNLIPEKNCQTTESRQP